MFYNVGFLTKWGILVGHFLNLFVLLLTVYIVRIQNESPQGVPLWYADYFQLKVTETLQDRETSATLSHLTT